MHFIFKDILRVTLAQNEVFSFLKNMNLSDTRQEHTELSMEVMLMQAVGFESIYDECPQK